MKNDDSIVLFLFFKMDHEQTQCVTIAENGENLFITGSAGTGKSFTINKIECILSKNDKKVHVTAMTGCAAILLSPKARTLHSWGGIGLGKEDVESLLVRIRKNKQALARWKTTDTLIIDEVSMLGPCLFEKLEELGRRIRRNPRFFGGIQLILGGDFFQLPPIEESEFLFQSNEFQKGIVKMIHLKTVYRQKEDLIWYQLLQNIRYGKLTKSDAQILQERINACKNVVDPTMTVLYPVNHRVDSTNESELSNLGQKIQEYNIRIEKGKLASGNDIEPLRNQMSIPNVIKLAKGAQVILTWNVDIQNGLVNGSQGKVVGFSLKNNPMVKFINLKNPIEIEPMEYSNDETKDTRISFYQLPLKLAWALSIHKVQGHNLDVALMDLGSQIFECGQIYVALSRIKTINGVYLCSFDANKIKVNPVVVEFYSKFNL